MRKVTNCERCIRGQVLRLGDELACVNCGWHPTATATSSDSPYRKILSTAF